MTCLKRKWNRTLRALTQTRASITQSKNTLTKEAIINRVIMARQSIRVSIMQTTTQKTRK